MEAEEEELQELEAAAQTFTRKAQRRLDAALSGLAPIGVTASASRPALSAEALQQRNLEIESEMLWLDGEMEKVDRTAPEAEAMLQSIDEQMDELAAESDEIEALLAGKHEIRGAGYDVTATSMFVVIAPLLLTAVRTHILTVASFWDKKSLMPQRSGLHLAKKTASPRLQCVWTWTRRRRAQ